MIQKWISLALLMCLLTALEAVNFKFISDNYQEIDQQTVIISICFIIAGIFSIIYLLCNRNKTRKCKLDSKLWIAILLLVILIISSRYVFLYSLNDSPNIGVSHMIVNLNVILSLLFAYFLFNQKIKKTTFIGVLVCFIGLFIIINSI